MEPSGRSPESRLDRWLRFAAIASVILLISACSLRRVWQTDFWWQYKTGRLVAAEGPPRVDPFSYTARGREWIEPRWLYCLTLAQICDRAGVKTAILVEWLVVLAAMALVAAPIVGGGRGRGLGGGVATALVLTLATLTARFRFTLRPEIATHLALAAMYWIIERYRKRGGRALLLLPLVQVLWVNSHTLFVLGPVLVGIFLAASLWELLRADRAVPELVAARRRAARAAALALAATLLACLANPYGLRIVGFTTRLFAEIRGTAFKEFIQEFESPFTYHGLFLSILAYKILIALGVVSLIVNLRRLDPFRSLFWASQLYLSALAVRNLPLFALAAIPFTIDNLARSEWWERARRPEIARWAAPLGRAGLAAIVVANVYWTWSLATDRFYVRQFETNQFGLGIATHRYPIDAASLLAVQAQGPVFSTMHESSYLLFRGFEVFFDPRLEVYPEEHFRRYVALVSGQGDWGAAVEEFGIHSAVVDVTFLGLIRQILADPKWRLETFDDCVALFARSPASGPDDHPSAPSPSLISAAIARVRERLPAPPPYEALPLFARAASPTPYHRVANLLITLGKIDEAEPFLRDAIAAYPGAAGARVSLGQILESRGDAPGAQSEYEAAYRWAPDDPDVLVALGRFYAVSQRFAEARPLLDRALARQPTNALAWALTGEIEVAAGRYDEAVRRLERATSLDPSNTMFAQRLAQVRLVRDAK